MYRTALIWYFGLAFAVMGSGCKSEVARDEISDRLISLSDVSSGRVQINGSLGIPLGTPAIVTAQVVSQGEPYYGKYELFALRVLSVNDRPLPNEGVVMKFEVPGSNPRLAASRPELTMLIERLKQPNAREYSANGGVGELPPISEAEANEFAENYVGSTFTLFVYETGGYFGAPEDLPSGLQYMRGTRTFAFSTRLVVLAEAPFLFLTD